MQIQSRELRLNMRGDDVALLHDELAQLGHTIAADERTALRMRTEIDDLDVAGRSFLVHRRIDGVGQMGDADLVVIARFGAPGVGSLTEQRVLTVTTA